LAFWPNYPEAYVYAGDAYRAAGDLPNALKYYSKALTGQYSAGADAFAGRGRVFELQGHYNLAEQDFGRAIASTRKPVYLNDIGLVFAEDHQPDNAILAFDKALEIQTNYVPALEYRAQLLADRGQYDKALADANLAVKTSAEAAAYAGLGYVEAKKGDVGAARSDLQKATTMAPLNPLYGRMLAALGGNGGVMDKVIAREPDRANNLVLRASTLLSNGESAKALSEANRAVDEAPYNPAAYSERAWIKHVQGDDAGALPDAEQAVTLNPKSAAALATRAEVYERLGRMREAEADYRASLAINADGAAAKAGLARVTKAR